MEVIKTIADLKKKVRGWKALGKTIGLVPTMGFLHPGHGSLIERAISENDVIIVSNFVNPTQFAPNEDLKSYPRDLDADCKFCENLGVHVMFCPDFEDMYHNPCTFIEMEGGLFNSLCGKTRPTHFRGVCTIVSKLFHLSHADRAYFGQKDAQQLFIIKKMVEDLNFDIEIIGCPIVREDDGLALSSRNTYLNSDERKAALCLSKSVHKGQSMIKKGMVSNILIQEMKAIIQKENLAKIDYLSVVDLEKLQDIDTINQSALVAMAVYIGKTRLIDNFIYSIDKEPM